MNQEESILVAIHCLVYNHEPYLRDCFDGFVMQKTNFRFVAIVHEDCSTDHSADIIREYEAKYPDIFRPIYETENQYSKPDGSLGRIMNEAIAATGAKYIAMCEGDDYWTDSYKLQKQVDFMEAHLDVGLCFSDFNIYEENTGVLRKAMYKNGMHRSKDFEDHLISCGYIAPMTWLARKSEYGRLVSSLPHTDGSFAVALDFFAQSKVAFIDAVTATYRVHNNSASRQSEPFKRWKYEYGVMLTQIEYAKKFGSNNLVEKVLMNNYLVDLLPLAIELEKKDFIEEARAFLEMHNIDFEKYYNYLRDLLSEEKRYNLVCQSYSYRIGRFLLYPVRAAKSKIEEVLLVLRTGGGKKRRYFITYS